MSDTVLKRDCREMHIVRCSKCSSMMAELVRTARLRREWPPVCAGCDCTRRIARHHAAVDNLIDERRRCNAARDRIVARLLASGHALREEP